MVIGGSREYIILTVCCNGSPKATYHVLQTTTLQQDMSQLCHIHKHIGSYCSLAIHSKCFCYHRHSVHCARASNAIRRWPLTFGGDRGEVLFSRQGKMPAATRAVYTFIVVVPFNILVNLWSIYKQRFCFRSQKPCCFFWIWEIRASSSSAARLKFSGLGKYQHVSTCDYPHGQLTQQLPKRCSCCHNMYSSLNRTCCFHFQGTLTIIINSRK